ncbi:extracellular solute-binding protein [Paenibacillus thalictri]|uniref:extracellular solute-binding protein n=1 Tax=Paenibacillus thalictri TaxID=2527873 RepID=UPI0013EEEBEE|nr:extracellular solute-binding protein [Paenibacillus thalictri]
MKQKGKTLTVSMLAFSFLLAACSSGGGSPTAGTGAGGDATNSKGGGEKAAAKPAEAPAAPVKITLLKGGTGLPAPDKDVLLQQLDKDLNMDLEFNLIPSEYEQQLNVRIAGGNPPDMMVLNKNQMFAYAKQGLLLDLTPYLKQMNNITPENGFTQDFMKKGQVNGKQYAIPYRPLIPVQTTFWVRQDWLDKLGLKPPKTLDELKVVAKAFVEKDPDGNGKKDTIGITGLGFEGTLSPIFAAFGVAAPGHLMIRDNKVVYSSALPETAKAIDYIKGMFDEGLIDPEFLTNTGLAHQEKAFKGQAGIVYAHWAHIKRPDMVQKMNSINPNQVWTQLDAMTGPGGKFADFFDEGNTSGRNVISKSLEKDPKKVEKIIEYLNYVSGGKGQLLVNYGIEGKHYKLNNGKVEINEATVAEIGQATIHQLTGRIEMDYLNTRFGAQKQYFEFTNNLPYIKAYDGFVPVPDGINFSDKSKYELEEMVKFVYGKRPTSDLPNFIKTLQSTYQLDRILSEAEKELKSLGIIK